MDSRTQIVLLTKRILRELEALIETVRSGLDGVREQLKGIREQQDKTNRKSNDSYQAHKAPEPLIVKMAEGVITRKDSCDKQEESDYQSKTLFWQRFTFWTLLAYAIITGYQAFLTRKVISDNRSYYERTICQMQAQTQAARDAICQAKDQFRKEERPYIWTTSQLGTIDFVRLETDLVPDVGHVQWSLHFTNYGKTPAFKCVGYARMKLGDHPWKIPLNQTADIRGIPVAPSADLATTLVSEPITRQEYAGFVRARGGVKIRLDITYQDYYGTLYESKACLERINERDVGFCGESSIK